MIRICAACGQENRVPLAHLADTGKCGQCKAPLPALDEPLAVGSKEFWEIVESAKVPVLVDFWAAWCGPCRMATPHVARVASEMAGKAIVLKVDTERHPDLAQEFQVRGIPNFAVLSRGRVVFQQPGLVDYQEMQRWLERATA